MIKTIFIKVASAGVMESSEYDALEYAYYEEGEFVNVAISSVLDMANIFKKISLPDSVVLIVPGEEVLLTSSFIPSKKEKQIQQALPYAIEEKLVFEVENSHISILGIDEARNVSVSIIAHEKMQFWLDEFSDVNLELNAIVPEILLLPTTPDEITVLVDQGSNKAVIRSGEYSGLVTSLGNLFVTLKSVLSSSADNNQITAKTVRIVGEDEVLMNSLLLNQQAYIDSSNVQFHYDVETATPFQIQIQQYLALSSKKQGQINALNGKYRVNQTDKKSVYRWQNIALVASILLVIQLSLNVFAGIYLNVKASDYRNESVALYQQLFPADTRIVNIRTQMGNHLNGGATTSVDNHFIQLLAIISQEIDSTMAIQFIRYGQNGDVLLVELHAINLAQLEAFERALNEEGLVAEIMSANQEDQIVRGRINISTRNAGAAG